MTVGIDFTGIFPNEIMGKIFCELNDSDLGRSRQVCSKWNALANDETFLKARSVEAGMVFGKAKWKKYFGDPEGVSHLPDNINEILESSCPIHEGKKIKNTHVLFYRPKQVAEKSHTVNHMGKCVPIGNNETGYRYIWEEVINEYGDMSAEEGEWLLMTREPLPGSRNMSYTEQQQLVKNLSEKAGVRYDVPALLDAITCLFVVYVDSRARLYGDDPFTYTRCQENIGGSQILVGGFSSDGLFVSRNQFDNNLNAVGAVRRLKTIENEDRSLGVWQKFSGFFKNWFHGSENSQK